MKKKKLFVFGIFFIFLIVITLIAFSSKSVKGHENLKNFEGEILLYKSPSCGCCGIYHSYFKNKGNRDVELVNIQDNRKIMEEYNIPSMLESCHTTIVGEYFVEGHVPLEAIEKLLSEKPDIAGIGMPGMPSGSPGMPGRKSGDFIIYGVNHNRSTFEFMRI